MNLIRITIGISFLFATFFVRCLSDQSAGALVALDTKMLKKVTHQRLFSNNNAEDTFSLTMVGGKISAAQISFTITNSKGEILYEENFPSEALIDYGILEINEKPNEKDKENYILKRMDTFFESRDFSTPAIKSNADYEAQYSNKTIWNTLKDDTTAVGFDYLLYEESGHSIAYSKKLKKVVEYFNCC